MQATIADITNAMETIAPSRLAEEWDNVGLQVGSNDWPVKTIRVALDPTPDVVRDACLNDVDLLITHHPLIFSPLRCIRINQDVGSSIQKAIQHQMAIYSAHTNLDNAADGLNDVLASRIGLKNLKVLGETRDTETYKLVVYVPAAYEHDVLNSFFKAKAGEIGSYSSCSFRNQGKGTFEPGPTSKPFSGKLGEIFHADEVRIETVVRKDNLNNVIEHMKKDHPYETVAYDIYPLLNSENSQGAGRIGVLDERLNLESFSLFIKKTLGLKYLKVAGSPELTVNTVAVCSGSGSSLLKDFFASGAQVYVSGDLKYHDARTAEAKNLGLIDIGHFASEHLIVDVLADKLKHIMSKTGFDVKVEAYKLENDPFMVL